MAKTKIEVDLVINGGDTVGQVEQKTKSLKSELRSMKELLASGTLDKGKFAELSLKAGQLQDKIGDVNQQVKALSSDAKGLDAFVSITQGIVGGFAAVQGITALVGDENEDLQKTMVKLQGAMAALNGLQAVAATLNKSSAASTTIMTFAQARYTAVVGGTTGALKLLRIAGAALGIGLIVAGIALLISNFDKLKSAVTKFLPDLSSLINFFKSAYYAVTDFLGISSEAERAVDALAEANVRATEQGKRDIEILKARGATARDIYLAERKLIEGQLQVLEAYVKANGKLSDKQIESATNLRHELNLLDETYFKEKEDKEAKAESEAATAREKRNKELRDKKKIQNQKDFDELFSQMESERDLEFEANQRATERETLQNQTDFEDLMAQLVTEQEQEQAYADAVRQNEIEAEKTKNERIIAERLATQSIIEDSFASANALGEAALGQQFKNTAAGKVLALAQIATDTALAISALVRNSQANQANAATGGIAGAVQFAAGIAQITTNIAKARSILTGGGTPSSGGSGSGGSVPNSQPPPARGFIPQSREKKDGITKVVVLEKDITDAVNKVARIRTNATLV